MAELVTIVIPCFNEEKYIEGCISSLINGDYNFIKIIVVDGGSTDNSIGIIRDLQIKYSNVELLSNPKRITPVSLNIGVQNANSNFIMIAGSHSQYPPNYISLLMKN